MEKTYYQILQISQDASAEVIKAAYKALAKKYHPDSYKGMDGSARMKDINVAYGVLSDETKRKSYDRELESRKKTEQNHQSHSAEAEKPKEPQTPEPDVSMSADDDEDLTDKNHPFAEKAACFMNSLRREMVKDAQKNASYRDNAYLDGLGLDEYTLIHRFKNATGFKKVGYRDAMVEKGLLYQDYDGKYKPTPMMKQYL